MSLKDYMTEKRLTQQELADKLGVAQYTVSRWCARGVPPKHLRRVARITRLPIVSLLPPELEGNR